jgi:sulfocyanin
MSAFHFLYTCAIAAAAVIAGTKSESDTPAPPAAEPASVSSASSGAGASARPTSAAAGAITRPIPAVRASSNSSAGARASANPARTLATASASPAPAPLGRANAPIHGRAPEVAEATGSTRAPRIPAPGGASDKPAARSDRAETQAAADPPTVTGIVTPAGPGDTRVNQFVSYTTGTKTVNIKLFAALNSAQGGFNFNGGSSGDQTITVPLGWTVNIDVVNKDAIPHSAIIIPDQTPLPNPPSTPAFPRAFTAHLTDGLPAQNGEDSMTFKATTAGNYLIACGVPGHALSGMYIRFVVSASATAPTNIGTIASQ